MLRVLKSTISMRHSFEHPKHILKLMGKKHVATILALKYLQGSHVGLKST